MLVLGLDLLSLPGTFDLLESFAASCLTRNCFGAAFVILHRFHLLIKPSFGHLRVLVGYH